MKKNYTVNHNSANPKFEWWMSWPSIIIFIIILWPLGLYFLFKRIAADKKAEMGSGRVLSVLGWIFVSFAALGIFTTLTAGIQDDDIQFILFFLISGLIMLYFGKRIKANAGLFKKYIEIVGNKHEYSLKNISNEVNLPADKVKTDLQKMIDKGYFSGAYIDEENYEIAMPDINENTDNEQTQKQSSVEMVVVKCKSCGANNKIAKHSVGECEFCGSPISGD